ncbi:hypothetical protein L226DRAFT_540469 [Lentinus tigrinus ALCF2SS1-7]|uniref:Uncharacterized protein n=1 Tax=Lentinus tigrinus ALCF2SS1-6 TaxID=1328759 RepID=A0A5C2RP41_9APHY|nr:hypothetical protein L227DRAFT_581336 [Lentinus tigrinus ALCF2SS1-6]RPD68657.1 hypothetical protein L226DRAFT_540469 [Lentinus tigrinus ALCF2SS1-7]
MSSSASSSSSSSSSSSYQSQEPPPRQELWWDRLPSLKIVRPPKGPFSPQVDERCFTFCSQSISGRIHGQDPWCRSICFRRVFKHEVERVLSHHRTKTVTQAPGKKPVVEIKDVVEAVPLKHPLPPEGQRYSGWLAMLMGDRFGRPSGSDQHASADDHTHDHDQAQAHVQRETRYWQEGWYLWWSGSRWAAQEKLDLMRRDLEGQSEWQRLKDRRNDEWARGLPPPGLEEKGQQAHDVHPFEDVGNAPPFPDVTSQSILLPLPIPPTSLPSLYTALHDSVQPALAPAGRVLALVAESPHRELFERVWEKAKSDEPRKLLVVAWGRVRENFFGGEGEGEGRGGEGSRGKGKDEKR